MLIITAVIQLLVQLQYYPSLFGIRGEFFDVAVQHGNDRIAVGNTERPAGQKIVLYVDYN